MQMEVFWERPAQGGQSEPIARFLSEQGLRSASGVQATVSLQESGRILACGGLDGNVIKTVAVDPAYQGQGLAEVLMTELRREAFSRGHRQLFIFTKPSNEPLFRSLSFFPVAACGEAMLLESTRGGLRRYLDALPKHGGNCGAVVMNCAPFTLGHQYLVDQARQACDWLYVFVLSEAKGMFPPEDRLELVRQGSFALEDMVREGFAGVQFAGLAQVRRIPTCRCTPPWDISFPTQPFPPISSRIRTGEGRSAVSWTWRSLPAALHRPWVFGSGLWAQSRWTL